MSFPALAFVDLETTGATATADRITEIGIVEVDADGVREWSTLVNPGVPISSFIESLTGISSAMVASAPAFTEVANEVLARLDGRLFIAHNARFDYGFLKNEFKRAGLDFRATVLCTVKLSRKLFPQHHRHNLDTLVTRHGLAVAGSRHRALADARLLWDLWRCWHEQLPVETIRSVVANLVGRPELPAQIDPALIDDLPEAAGAYAFYGEDGRLLLLRRASNLRQQVLAHFTAAKRETPLLRDLRRVDWRAAAGELGARLREIELSRSAAQSGPQAWLREPGGSNAGAAARGLCSWPYQARQNGHLRPELVFAEDLDFAIADDLFGIYPSHREATRSLRKLADAQRLCYKLLGLDDRAKAGPCAAYRQKSCRGVCIGRETLALHGARVLIALAKFKLRPWPYKGPLVLLERDEFGMREDVHLVDRWRLVATVHSEEALQERLANGPTRQPFDPDIYRVIGRYLHAGKIGIRPLPPFSL